MRFPAREDDRVFPQRACALASFFLHRTWRSARSHPGKPEYFTFATPIFFFRARPDPNVLVPNKRAGRQSSFLSVSLRKGSLPLW
jgi:hypothetical protein